MWDPSETVGVGAGLALAGVDDRVAQRSQLNVLVPEAVASGGPGVV